MRAASGFGVLLVALGPGTPATAELYVPVIDYRQGTPFSPQVRGQCPYRSVPESGYPTIWALARGASGRGLAGGLDADTYDWRNINSGANWGLVGGHFTTLQFLQYARDHQTEPLLTANAFGGGYKDPNDGTFICQTDNPEGLAADWVRYTNIILQSYRQGDEGTMTAEDLRVYTSIADWGGRPTLRTPLEGGVPPVRYWEIGNEPELGTLIPFLSHHYLSPTDYRDRYKSMTQAMLAVDPTLQIGPCLINPSDANGSGQWLAALAADPAVPLAFVGYHPYYSSIKVAWGDPPGMTAALRAFKDYLKARAAGIRSIMSQNGRSGYDLMATEWNPVNWDAPGNVQRSVAQGLGVAEGVFTFAEDGVKAAHFWEQPQSKLAARDVFAGLRDHMGDVLVANCEALGLTPALLNWRLYVTRNSGDDRTVVIWGLNFDDEQVVQLDLGLAPCRIDSAILKRYGIPGGDTSLMHSSGMAWSPQDVTQGLGSKHFVLTLQDAEVTVLVLRITPVPRADGDRDGDVDQEDFGHFQACFSGFTVPQTDPACQDARLDLDTDVDEVDFSIFQDCMTGPNLPADPDCAR